ncbi:hypothetical protein ACKXGF_13540 [Alkalibacillus sp. S2W]|uniref:hypothetical protein n=1 Tax=Alkalibacillus sp. S2W TaxID=3386553 RepID=UPI00398D0EED
MANDPWYVMDTGIISRFALSDQFDILRQLYGPQIFTPTDVIAEVTPVIKMKQQVDQALKDGWMHELTISYREHNAIFHEFIRLRKRFGVGESATLATARHMHCVACSDDMRAAVKYCNKHHIPLKGSLGILYDAYLRGLFDKNKGQTILETMIHRSNYKSPVSDFQTIIDAFEGRSDWQLF